MATKSARRNAHTFSTNFFGVTGYMSLVLIWLLALTCALTFIPVETSTHSATSTTAFEWVYYAMSPNVTYTTVPVSPLETSLKMLLFALLLLVAWAFSFFASKFISRIVRRFARLSTKTLTIASLMMTKYILLAIGLIVLVTLLVIAPIDTTLRMAIAFPGFTAGIGAVVSIAVQQRIAARHHVPIAQIL